MERAEARLAPLECIRLRGAAKDAAGSDHGLRHWRQVEANARRLAAATPGADLDVVVMFARVHDGFRVNEYRDPDHGPAAGRFVRTTDLGLTPEQVETLAYACELHDGGQTSTDPTVGVCWDADRLDLGRVGITPDPRYFSTDAGRKLAQGGLTE